MLTLCIQTTKHNVNKRYVSKSRYKWKFTVELGSICSVLLQHMLGKKNGEVLFGETYVNEVNLPFPLQ